MIARRVLLAAAGSAVLLAPFVSRAQKAQARIYRIGYLSSRSGIEMPEEILRDSLRKLGYTEGENLIIEWRFVKGRVDQHPEAAAELVRLKADCIVASGTNATRAAKQATNAIPIVISNMDADPVRLGLVASLARPGGNITGLIAIAADLAGKRLDLLRETVPNLSRVAVLFDPGSEGASANVREARTAAAALGMQLQIHEIQSAESFDDAFRAMGKARPQALLVVGAGLVQNYRARVVDFTFKAHLPAVYGGLLWVLEGGLMSYGASTEAQFRRAAAYVDRVLKGAKPADLPIEQPTKFELAINLKTARQIGLKIPQSVLTRADRVIE
ncbi:MAG TPA: ABC transporter substrate-binding protein [Burkholderiales bacterium]|nr:ABC transporter substrate-binding protein [Burkholderiales bacterium]